MDLREALIAAAALLLPVAAAAQVDRFAVVIGNDAGQAADAALRYAQTDAERIASVLEDVGGVRPENLTLLRGQDASTVRRALIAVNDRIRASSGETVLIVYYSGHADAESLHLGTTQLDLGKSSSWCAARQRGSASSSWTRAAPA